MNSRFKEATICAYSCRPNSGSEWGVGWNYFLFCSKKFNKVRLIVRNAEGQKDAITKYVKEHSLEHCEVIFINDTLLLRELFHQNFFPLYVVLEYIFWQFKCARMIRSFDIKPEFLLHVTWVSDWLPSFIHLASPAQIKIYGPIGSQNINFNQSYFHYYNIFNLIKTFIRFNPINVFNACKTDGLIAISERFSERLPWRIIGKRISITPVNSEIRISPLRINKSERRTMNFIGKNLQFKNFDLFIEGVIEAKKNFLIDEANVFGDFPKDVITKYSDINFHGVLSQDAVFQLILSNKSVVFQPSCEAGGTIGIEALSQGVPVVTFQGYGLSEFFPENKYQIPIQHDWTKKLNIILNDIYANYEEVQNTLISIYEQKFTSEINYEKFATLLDQLNVDLD